MPFPISTLYPGATTYPGSVDPTEAPPRRISVREKPPLRLSVNVETPDGKHGRWAADEPDPANAPAEVTFSSTIPGGFEQLSTILPRKPGTDYPDLQEFSEITAEGVGGQTAWQGRLETTPRASGNQMAITPGAVGHQAALDDDQAVKEIYVDIDQSAWQPSTLARKALLYATYPLITAGAASADPVSQLPAVIETFTTPYTKAACEAQYDGKGVPIGSLYYAWQRGTGIVSPYTNWAWQAYVSTNDGSGGGSTDITANLAAAGPGAGTIDATAGDRTWAGAYLTFGTADSANGVDRTLEWTCLAVYGNHGLTRYGTAGSATAQGLIASDVVQHAVNTYVPELATSYAGQSTITPSSVVIPHLTFTDPTTVSQIITQAIRFELLDWAVWEGPTFWLHPRGARGRLWQARTGNAQLQETGPQVDRIFNSVMVSYQDITGTTRTVGPTGSGADTIDDSLTDADSQNPATLAGITRRALLQMGITSTPAAATALGQIFLQEQKTLSTAGQATLTGYVDDEHGVTWPAWLVRAGDQISFIDSNSTGYRRIVRASYTHSARSCVVDLDSPPDGLQALLQRLGAVLTPLGF